MFQAERKSNLLARDKMTEEHANLTRNGLWDLSGACSWREVADEASAKGQKAHKGQRFRALLWKWCGAS